MTHSKARLDAYEKVTGAAVYSDDLAPEGMLYLKEVHCPFPHARIDGIDTKGAQKIPDVVCVITAGEIPPTANRPLEKPLLADEEVLCADEAVALVAAKSEKAARMGAEAVRVRYSPLPAVLTINEALKPDAVPVQPGGNIACECILEHGDCAGALSSAEVVVEHSFSTQRMHHGAVEPDCVLAEYGEETGFQFFCGSKGPFNVQREVAEMLNVPLSKVHVRHAVIGGGFGGKLCDTVSLCARAGIAARLTGRPCKLLWTREETMTEGIKRHPFQMTVRIGAKRDGAIVAVEFLADSDAGAYLAHTKGVMFRAMAECLGPYAVPNAYVRTRGVYTHNVQSDAVRGFGTPQVAFAMEGAMDLLAKKLGMTPFEIRMKNLIQEGGCMPSGQTARYVGIQPCMEKLRSVFDMERPVRQPFGNRVRGWGISCIQRGESHGALSKGNDICGIDVDVQEDGVILLSSSVSEVGQGAYTAEAMVLSELMGLPLEQIRVRGADTDVTPPCTTTSGSRGTISGVNAVYFAYLDLLKKMTPPLAKRLGASEANVFFEDGSFRAKDSLERISFDKAAALCRSLGVALHGEGRWVGPYTGWDWEKHTGTPYYSYAYSAAAAEVEVDLITGMVHICDLVCVCDLGHIVNYEEAKAQTAGGLMMSIGFALTEESTAPQGLVTAKNFDRYIMPMANDMEQIRPMPVELVRAGNPMGVHGVGELSASIAAPAIANAVSNALGQRMDALPMTLERVRTAVDKGKEAETE